MFSAFSVPKIWVPTQFQSFDAEESDRCNLAGCENYRVPEGALRAIERPDSEWLRDHWLAQDEALRASLGERYGVASEQVFLTSGAIGAIRYSFEVFGRPGAHVGLMRPEWPGFRYYAEHSRAHISYTERPGFPFRFEANDLIDFVRREDIEFVILSNPSAVTGYLWETEAIDELLSTCPETLFVIDEADAIYPHLSAAALVDRHDNCLVLGSFSKFYGLSGLRIGYLMTPAAYVHHFEHTINPAELTSLSLVAARSALADEGFQLETQATVAANLARLEAVVAATPFELVGESRCFAAYLWGDESVEDPRDFLARQGIDIVAGEIFGLDRGGRVNLSDPERIERLSAALSAHVETAAAH